MAGTRAAAVAGIFYPRSQSELQTEVKSLLAGARSASGPPPRALIAPHAGYAYSGPIAASAYARLAPVRDTVRRVAMMGPSHRVPFEGIAASGADAWTTPLGTVPVDRDGVATAEQLPSVTVYEHAHADEHSLEVQLPFLQSSVRSFSIVPLLVGEATDDEAEKALEAFLNDQQTLVVVSSDLSHYHDYETARILDQAASRAIESLDPSGISWEQACGGIAIRGLLRLARRLDMSVATLDLRSSGDTSGSRDRVVGYGAWAFYGN